MFYNAQLGVPVGMLARGASQNAMTHQGGHTRQAGRCAAVDPEGFAHSAAVARKSSAAVACIGMYMYICISVCM